jgi:hypothetical protein
LVLPTPSLPPDVIVKGNGSWTSSQGADQFADFYVEVQDDGAVTGHHTQTNINGTLTAKIDQLYIYTAGHACFGGTITEATGAHATKLGMYKVSGY